LAQYHKTGPAKPDYADNQNGKLTRCAGMSLNSGDWRGLSRWEWDHWRAVLANKFKTRRSCGGSFLRRNRGPRRTPAGDVAAHLLRRVRRRIGLEPERAPALRQSPVPRRFRPQADAAVFGAALERIFLGAFRDPATNFRFGEDDHPVLFRLLAPTLGT
jgi:hypothetical protein